MGDILEIFETLQKKLQRSDLIISDLLTVNDAAVKIRVSFSWSCLMKGDAVSTVAYSTFLVRGRGQFGVGGGEYQHWQQEPTAGINCTNDCDSGAPLPTCHLPNLTYPFGSNDITRSVDICYPRFVHISHFTRGVSVVLHQFFGRHEELVHLDSVETNTSRDVWGDKHTQIFTTCEKSTQPAIPE